MPALVRVSFNLVYINIIIIVVDVVWHYSRSFAAFCLGRARLHLTSLNFQPAQWLKSLNNESFLKSPNIPIGLVKFAIAIVGNNHFPAISQKSQKFKTIRTIFNLAMTNRLCLSQFLIANKKKHKNKNDFCILSVYTNCFNKISEHNFKLKLFNIIKEETSKYITSYSFFLICLFFF